MLATTREDKQEALRRSHRAISTCYERWRSLLWQGCVAAVIELKELHASGRYTDKQCYDIQGEINYFTEERMDYPLYTADQRSSGVRVTWSLLGRWTAPRTCSST